MISYFDAVGCRPVQVAEAGGVPALPDPASLVWIDLYDPTQEEENAVERLLNLQVPTAQEMAEIEESARLYEENGALVMTALVINGVAEGRPSRAQVTFVLTPTHFVSLRYSNPLPFRTFDVKCQRQPEAHKTAESIFASLLESIVDRAADVLEMVQTELNDVSSTLFFTGTEDTTPRRKASTNSDRLQVTLKRLGRKNLTLAILRESLWSLTRLTPFVRQGADAWLSAPIKARLKQVDRDLRSLTTYEAQLSAEIQYLHDATLGLINLEQNRIIKVFSIAAVLFLPPTLVGTIYGMNFSDMPELGWALGYPFALFLMILSSIVPYYWFKRKGWF
jgi:magnesium transporter